MNMTDVGRVLRALRLPMNDEFDELLVALHLAEAPTPLVSIYGAQDPRPSFAATAPQSSNNSALTP